MNEKQFNRANFIKREITTLTNEIDSTTAWLAENREPPSQICQEIGSETDQWIRVSALAGHPTVNFPDFRGLIESSLIKMIDRLQQLEKEFESL